MKKQLTIGLFGFGCVGVGLYEVLSRTPGLNAHIKKICIRNPEKPRPINISNFTFNPDDLLHDPEINVIVELIDDADAAFSITRRALQNGKAVVSANKKMIAEHFLELLELQQEHGTALLYEAACCASLPVIRNLEEYYDNDLLASVRGIVNGSTNYILTRTATDGIDYKSALKLAQEKGYAESDPSLDTGGFDAKYKLLILLAHAFGHIATPDELLNIGIDDLGALELKYAAEKGHKIKLIAQAYKTGNGQLAAFVLPEFVSPDDRLFHVDDVFNGVVAQSGFADEQFFAGRGAGAHPTASAVLSDISALAYDYRYEYKKIRHAASFELAQDIDLEVLLRHEKNDAGAFKTHFKKIRETYLNGESGYITGTLSLATLKKLHTDKSRKKSFVLLS